MISFTCFSILFFSFIVLLLINWLNTGLKPHVYRISFVAIKLLKDSALKLWHISPFQAPPKSDNHFGMECNRIIPTSHRHSNRHCICSPHGLPVASDPFRQFRSAIQGESEHVTFYFSSLLTE